MRDPKTDVPLALRAHAFVRATHDVKPMVDIPGEDPKWMGGLMVLTDRSRRERLVTRYARMGQNWAADNACARLFCDVHVVS